MRVDITLKSRQFSPDQLILRPDGTQVPRAFPARFTDLPGLPGVKVEMSVAVDDFARVTCTRLEVSGGDDGIKGSTLRDLPIKALLDEATFAAWSFLGKRTGSQGKTALGPGEQTAEDFTRLLGDLRTPRHGSPITEDNLQQVAAWVRQARAENKPPVDVVKEAASVSKATAYRWIKAARKAGMDLGEAS